MRLRHATPFVLVFAACSRNGPPAPDADPNHLTADAFCRLLFEAPKRSLATRCTRGEKTSAEYARLERIASRPLAACVAALEPSRAAGRLELPKQPAEACARALEAASFKTTLRSRDLANHAECGAGLWTGKQAEALPCRTSLDCAEGLWCDGATFDSDGACRKRGNVGEKCDAPLLFLFDEVRASCSDGNACDFGSFRPAYALGDSLPFSPELERELAKRRDLQIGDSFGSGLGPIGTGASDIGTSGRGDGIGLGSIGTFGSSGRGLLGRSHSGPRVRMGATTVNGRLPPEVIQRIVRQNFGRFRLCYEQGLRKNPKLEGRVSVRFVIGRDGAVATATPSGSLPDASVAECVTRAMKGLSFPQPEGGLVTVDYPIHFSPGDTATSATDGGAPDAGAPDATTTDAATAPSPRVPSKSAESPLACIATIPSGKACAAAHHCPKGLTCRAGQCEALGNAGEACESDLECKPDHYCGAVSDTAGARGVCKALGATGAACTHSSQCRGACIDQKCSPFCGAE